MKATKQHANYLDHATRGFCRNCEHWRNGSCVEVQGSISPDGTCDYYEPDVPDKGTGEVGKKR